MKTLVRCLVAIVALCLATPVSAQKQHKTVYLPPALPPLSPEAQLALDELSQKHEIDWHWVKGHAGDEMNERVDALARQGMEPFKKRIANSG